RRGRGPAGRERVAAVPGHTGGDAVIARRGGEGLEGELRVVVRVDVDDAGHDDEPAGVDRAARAGEPSDVGDEAVADADVGAAHGEAGAVHDRAALDDGVERHVIHPMYFSSLYAPSAHWPPTRPTPTVAPSSRPRVMKRSTRVRWAAETSGPTTTPGSRGSPIRSVGPAAARRRVNAS